MIQSHIHFEVSNVIITNIITLKQKKTAASLGKAYYRNSAFDKINELQRCYIDRLVKKVPCKF